MKSISISAVHCALHNVWAEVITNEGYSSCPVCVCVCVCVCVHACTRAHVSICTLICRQVLVDVKPKAPVEQAGNAWLGN